MWKADRSRACRHSDGPGRLSRPNMGNRTLMSRISGHHCITYLRCGQSCQPASRTSCARPCVAASTVDQACERVIGGVGFVQASGPDLRRIAGGSARVEPTRDSDSRSGPIRCRMGMTCAALGSQFSGEILTCTHVGQQPGPLRLPPNGLASDGAGRGAVEPDEHGHLADANPPLRSRCCKRAS